MNERIIINGKAFSIQEMVDALRAGGADIPEAKNTTVELARYTPAGDLIAGFCGDYIYPGIDIDIQRPDGRWPLNLTEWAPGLDAPDYGSGREAVKQYQESDGSVRTLVWENIHRDEHNIDVDGLYKQVEDAEWYQRDEVIITHDLNDDAE